MKVLRADQILPGDQIFNSIPNAHVKWLRVVAVYDRPGAFYMYRVIETRWRGTRWLHPGEAVAVKVNKQSSMWRGYVRSRRDINAGTA